MPWRPVNALFFTHHSLSSACQSFHWLCPVLSSQRRDRAASWLLAKVPSFRGFCLQSARNQSICQSTYCTWGQYSVRPEQQATEEEQRTVLYLRSIPLISEHFHKSFQCLSFLLEAGCTQLVFTVHLRAHTFTTTIIRCANFFLKEIALDGDLMESGAVLDSRCCE